MTQIRMSALRHSAFYTPYLMTIAGGFLREEGLEPVYQPIAAAASLNDALRAGEVEVAQSAVAASFAELEAGAERLDVVHFAQINARDGFFIAAREPEPNFTWQRLRGRRVLVDHFFQPLAMLRYGLHRQGVDYADLEPIDAGDVEAIERAFRSGQGDYVHMQGPAPQQLAHEGLAEVVAAVGDAVGPVAFSSLCATREWLDGAQARAFMRAYRAARRLSIEAPAEEVAARLTGVGFFGDIDAAVLTDTVGSYQRLGCWEPEVAIAADSYERLLDVFLFSGQIHRRYDYRLAVVDPPD